MSSVEWGSRPSKKAKPTPSAASALDAFVQADQRVIKRLNLNIPIELHRRVKASCAAEGLEMTEVIVSLLEQRFPRA